MTGRRVSPPPFGLAGTALHARLTADPEIVFSAAELVVLELACHQADNVAALEALLDSEGLVVTGSQGQPRLSSVVAELRLQRAALARLVTQLAIPEEDEAVGQTPTQRKAQRAADARWGRQARAREARNGASA